MVDSEATHASQQFTLRQTDIDSQIDWPAGSPIDFPVKTENM